MSLKHKIERGPRLYPAAAYASGEDSLTTEFVVVRGEGWRVMVRVIRDIAGFGKRGLS